MNKFLVWRAAMLGESILNAASGKSVDAGLLRHLICNVDRPEQVSEADFLAVMDAVVGAIQMLPVEEQKKEWVPVGKRLPDPYETSLISIATKNGYDEPITIETIGFYEKGEWLTLGGNATPACHREYERVTHWRPMPEPPEE